MVAVLERIPTGLVAWRPPRGLCRGQKKKTGEKKRVVSTEAKERCLWEEKET